MRRVLVVGGSIAGVTAASTLRADGWNGHLTVLSDEAALPYSRVPLSKGVLAGTQPLESAALAALPDDVELRRSTRAAALRTERHAVELADGTELEYDGLIVATGSRARRLASAGQHGEHVIRTLADAEAIAARIPDAQSAVVVGASFLGMEVASTLRRHGLAVTVIDRDPPLRRLLGEWLADVLVERAADEGVQFVLAPDGVQLRGDPVNAVTYGAGQELHADLIITAAGDLPNVEWLESSGLHLAGGLVIDNHCRVATDIVAAGDVTICETSPGSFRRTPHWSNAVAQARAAARSLLDPESPPYQPDHYFWTEQFGIDLKIAGELPLHGEPRVLDGDLSSRSALMQWHHDGIPVAAATLNYRMSVVKLKALAQPVTA